MSRWAYAPCLANPAPGQSKICVKAGEEMLRRLLGAFGKKKKHKEQAGKPGEQSQKFSGKFAKDERLLRGVFRDCGDVKFRSQTIPALGGRQALFCFVEGLINTDTLQRDILGKLLTPGISETKDIRELLAVGDIKVVKSPDELTGDVLLGQIAIIVAGEPRAYVVEAKDWPKRNIEEPIQERLIRGPRVGFIEAIEDNLALIRRRLPDPSLKLKMYTVGRRSRTKVALLYIDDVCDLSIVREMDKRIRAIDIDVLAESGCLEDLIAERTVSPFPQVLQTERPDKVAGGLAQGQAAIVTDGSPYAMLAPVTFSSFLQTPGDYFKHSFPATIARSLRFIGLFLGTTLVASYVAVLSFHYEIVPTNIVVFIAETRAGVPFNPLTEALLLEFSSEILREASIRLPGPIGPTLGIVGALILGQAAVAAHLVSPIMLFLVALTFILSSIIPNYEASEAVRYLRFPIIVAAGFI